ncbi:hypothetical protein TD95_004733 [Thielaviopsis punctulata]|uniref:LITAF domain-containing protein n=1 Tax=Thielaviopsis punctulata TaxID=72032 RepID=A0A0F4Z9N4_9PEZI|nr:hypothetical protein TD95_004733 [Thielaviopsis punctulata]
MAISYDNPAAAAAAAAAANQSAQPTTQSTQSGQPAQNTQSSHVESGLELQENQSPTITGQNQPGLMLLNEISSPPYPADARDPYSGDNKTASATQPLAAQPISPMSTGVTQMFPPSAPSSPPPPMHSYPAAAPAVHGMSLPQQSPTPGPMSPQLPPNYPSQQQQQQQPNIQPQTQQQPHVQPQTQQQPHVQPQTQQQPQFQAQAFQHAQVHAPTSTMPLSGLQSYPALVECPNCHYRGQTILAHESGGTTHLVAALTCFVTCLGCIPYLLNGLKDVRHRCAQCGIPLALFHRSGRTDVLVQAILAPEQQPQMQQTMQMPAQMQSQYQQHQQPVFAGQMSHGLPHPMQQYPPQQQQQQQGVLHAQPAGQPSQ